MIEDIDNLLRTHYSSEINEAMDGKEVILNGWVRAIRKVGKMIFLQLSDREGTIQITVKKDNVSEELWEKFENLGREYVVAIKGNVSKNKIAPRGIEIIPSDLKILNIAEGPLPIEVVTKKTPAELPTRLDWRVIDLRKPEVQAIFKIQAALVNGMEEWLIKNGFIRVFTPTLKGAPSESGATLFPVSYFDKVAYLREATQLHRQLLMGAGFDKTFEIGPVWRAEESHTVRHISEIRGVAVEKSFIKDEYEVMKIEENVLVAGLKAASNCKKELEILGKKISIPKLPLPVLEFPKIYDILHELGSKTKEDEDLSRDDEKLLADYVKEKYKTDYFFINKFPYEHKPFYVYTDGKYARSTDLEAKGGIELSSGGQREHRYDVLIKQIKEKGLSLKNLEWYTKFFKYGMPPHGGFKIGVERLTMVMLDLPNIREAVTFPRDPERLLP